MIKHLHSDSIC